MVNPCRAAEKNAGKWRWTKSWAFPVWNMGGIPASHDPVALIQYVFGCAWLVDIPLTVAGLPVTVPLDLYKFHRASSEE